MCDVVCVRPSVCAKTKTRIHLMCAALRTKTYMNDSSERHIQVQRTNGNGEEVERKKKL